MNFLNLDAICRIDRKTEPSKGGSLCGYLQSLNKLAFGIELSPVECLTHSQKNHIINGLIRLITKGEEIRIKPPKKITTFIRQQYFVETEGFFRPLKPLRSKIRKGDVIGVIFTGSKKQQVRSSFTGTLISVSYPRLIKKRETLFTVGKAVK